MQRVIERILNLLAFLLTVGRPVTADEIRHTVAGYDRDTDEAFRRTFERDKDLLRGLGVPLRMDFTDRWQVEQGYIVRPDEYGLPDPGLTDDERAALWLATGMARLGGEAAGPGGILKLGGGALPPSADPLSADLGTDAEMLGSLFGAIVERRRIGFRYHDHRRGVAPLGLVHRMGHWYLVGEVRGETRTYRVDRITELEVGSDRDAFTPPAGFRASDGFPDAPWEAGQEDVAAVVRFTPAVAWWARRQLPADTSIADQADGSLVAHIHVASTAAFIGWLIGFEDGALLEGPVSLRRQFIAHLRSGI
ncbi:MAG: WYL domain-containing protein [Acidimicrobiia bacterium]|nr:WYL domain-containing protein [Acidimicrobiia bacterium]